MLRSSKSILLTLLIGFIAVPSFAGTAAGYVYFRGSYNSYSLAPSFTYVKFCLADAAGLQGQGQCYVTTTSGGYFSLTLPDFRSYVFFAYYNAYDWGSSSTRGWTSASGYYAEQLNFATSVFFTFYSELRPHQPSAVYPANGATNVPLAFTLKWTSGIDAARNWPGVWNTVYDIYSYGEGGTEIKVLSDIPCNPDASGYCSYYIDNVVPNWRYYWRVEPKITVDMGGRVYSQSSQTFTFVTQP